MKLKKYMPNFMKEIIINLNYFIFTKNNHLEILEDEKVIELIVNEKKISN